MKLKKTDHLPAISIVIMLLFSIFLCNPFYSCDPDDDKEENDSSIHDYKPNIYLYPTQSMFVEVKLNFPLGGRVTESEPLYKNGWEVYIDTTGLIDSTYRFLFYESKHPDTYQYEKGWCIEKSKLQSFFTGNLAQYGFKGQEITDFTDYWVPRLKDYDFYKIYPQDKAMIERCIELRLNKNPDNVQRLFYAIKGCYSYEELPEPNMIVDFKREGFFVAEWGVVLK